MIGGQKCLAPERKLKLTKLKIIVLIAVGVLAVVALGIFTWSNASIRVNIEKPDPAVLVANELAIGDIRYEEGYVGEAGTRIHYVSAGEGEPIIFAHGFPSYWFTMFTLMEEFKSEYRVIAFDGLGTGRSDAPSSVDAYKVEALTRAIDLLMTELDLDQAHLVGHDWGATLVTGYARANPSKVKSVTTIAALPHNIIVSRAARDAEHRELFSYAEYFSRANPALIMALGVKDQVWETSYADLEARQLISGPYAERLRADIGNPRRLDRFIHWYRANMLKFDDLTDDDFWPDRGIRLKVPTILIYGDKDIVVTDALVDDFRSQADELDVIKLEGVGHRPHFEQPETVVAAIKDLIARTSLAS